MFFYTLTAFCYCSGIDSVNRAMQDALIAADRLFEIIDLETEQTVKGGIEEFPTVTWYLMKSVLVTALNPVFPD
jgi:hypothetical protein